MALAFQGYNVALVEDLDLPDEKLLDSPKVVEQNNEPYTLTSCLHIGMTFQTYLEALESASQVSAHNCWVAAGLYVVTLAVSLHQFWVNTRAPSSGYQRQY
jgi:hypothetical protein